MIPTKDSNGTELKNAGNVALVKDLKVKGADTASIADMRK